MARTSFAHPLWQRPLALAMAAAVAFTVLAATGGDARATAHQETYLQLNLCGNACNRGAQLVVSAVANFIVSHRPSAVTLNEVCENQYDALRDDLVIYHGRFDATGPMCHNGYRYGNAVLVRTAGVSLVGSWPLPSPAGDEARRLMCLRAQLPGPATALLVCVTHISNVSANIAAQVGAVAGVVRGLAATGALVLGGDFNTDPGDARMDPLYGCRSGAGGWQEAGPGGWQEADARGCASRALIDGRAGGDIINEHTWQRHKYDYMFVGGNAVSWLGAQVTDAANGLSDHAALEATVAWTAALPA
jgi:endonuclease/exonuclease/phosphatase family metal-dependent hydrolase